MNPLRLRPAAPFESRAIDSELNESSVFHFGHIHGPAIGTTETEIAGTLTQHVDFTKDFFNKPSYLTVSGQLQGEAFACALGKIYTFGPTFRAENSNTPRHLAEFWMIEPEVAFNDLTDNMNLAEAFLKDHPVSVLNKPFNLGLLDALVNRVLTTGTTEGWVAS